MRGRDPERLPSGGDGGTEPSLDPFIPRRGDGLMLSASDIETYRLCPLKYKFARVFRIPQESTIHQRFGIVLHQVLERFHQYGRGTREELFDNCSSPRGGAAASATPTTSCSSASARWRRSTATGRRARDRRGRAGVVRAQLLVQARARTCCAAAWTAWTGARTAATS